MFETFKKYLIAQKNAIDKSVYIASEKARKNLRLDNNGQPTEEFFINWINCHSAKFRIEWEQSSCKECKKINECYDCVKTECERFERDQ